MLALSQTMWMAVTRAEAWSSIAASSSMNSRCRFLSRSRPMTSPVRVSNAAKSCRAPLRSYSCSTETGTPPGCAGRFSADRVLGCNDVFSSRLQTCSSRSSGRVYSVNTSRTVARKASSISTFGLNQWWTRHGLSFCENKIRCTDCGEIDSTTPLSIAVRANSAQLQSDSDRPALSASSHASLTRCVATTGGKKRHPSASRLVAEAFQPLFDEAFPPLPNDLALLSDPACDCRHALAIREQQHDHCSQHVAVGHRLATRPHRKFLPLLLAQLDLNRGRVHAHPQTTGPLHGPTFWLGTFFRGGVLSVPPVNGGATLTSATSFPTPEVQRFSPF